MYETVAAAYRRHDSSNRAWSLLAPLLPGLPDDARPSDIDVELLDQARHNGGKRHATNAGYLVNRNLAVMHLRNPALLAFGKHGYPDHTRAGVSIRRVIGVRQRNSAMYNVDYLLPCTGNLHQVFNSVKAAMRKIIRRPAAMGADSRFVNKDEYPLPAWEEAVVNALTHRDYCQQGIEAEACVYDNRITISSPAELEAPLTVAELKNWNAPATAATRGGLQATPLHPMPTGTSPA